SNDIPLVGINCDDRDRRGRIEQSAQHKGLARASVDNAVASGSLNVHRSDQSQQSEVMADVKHLPRNRSGGWQRDVDADIASDNHIVIHRRCVCRSYRHRSESYGDPGVTFITLVSFLTTITFFAFLSN